MHRQNLENILFFFQGKKYVLDSADNKKFIFFIFRKCFFSTFLPENYGL